MPPISLKNRNVSFRVKQWEINNQSTFLNSQHFEGRRACWSSRMGLGQTHKQEFKKKSICITKEKKRLM
jgi:hypothetical protein